MNLFYTNLKSIYDSNFKIRVSTEFEPLHLALRTYIIRELNRNNHFLNPSEVAYNYAINPLFIMEIFLEFHNSDLLIKKYLCTCLNCYEEIIVSDLSELEICPYCKEKYNFSTPDNSKFNNIEYLFEITDEFKEWFDEDLKSQPSSLFSKTNGEGKDNISAQNLLESDISELKETSREQQVLKTLLEGIDAL